MTGATSMIDALPNSVASVCADEIFAIGGSISGDLPLTWSPRYPSRWLPVQCYFLRSGGETLLIDTGLAVHRDQIMAGLSALIGNGQTPRMTMTRWEPDSIINLPDVVRGFDIQHVIWSGPLNPLDFFEGMDQASTSAHVQATTGIVLERCPPGSILTVGELQLEIIRPTMAVLATYWFYESKTRSLFTSDSFGFVTTADEPSGPVACRRQDCDVPSSLVEQYLGAKFDWMIGIDTKPLIDDLLEITSSRAIDRFCPCFGCIAEGADAVSLLISRTVTALEKLAQREHPSATAGIDWSRIRAAIKNG